METPSSNHTGISKINAIVAGIVVIIPLVTTMAVTIGNSRKADRIHDLVNSRLTLALTMQAEALEKIAKMTGDPADLESAKQARREVDILRQENELIRRDRE